MDLIDCPECALPAEVVDRFWLASTSGPVEHMSIRCVGGHQLTPRSHDLEQADDHIRVVHDGRGDPSRN